MMMIIMIKIEIGKYKENSGSGSSRLVIAVSLVFSLIIEPTQVAYVSGSQVCSNPHFR